MSPRSSSVVAPVAMAAVDTVDTVAQGPRWLVHMDGIDVPTHEWHIDQAAEPQLEPELATPEVSFDADASFDGADLFGEEPDLSGEATGGGRKESDFGE